MQKDGYITAKALPLLCASKKLATKIEILQHKNQGLKKALVEEKKKQKREKKLVLYKEGKSAGQARFFRPSWIEQACQQVANKVEAEQQRKQDVQDCKLKAARVQAEKAREKQERKTAHVIAHEAAKVERERDKAK